MYLTQINYSNFRCLKDKKIELNKNFNLIYGKNGQGKTSLMEAVHFLATGKSFRTKKNIEIIKYNENRLTVFGKINYDNKSTKALAIELNENKKKYFINKNKYNYIDYIGKLNIVSFIPEEIELIIGSPYVRRNFFNYEISQMKKDYLKSLVNYEKLLKIRSKFLKEQKKDELFNIYNEMFIEEGVNLIFYRQDYVKNISVLLNENYKKLFDKNSELKLKYESFLGNIENDSKEILKEKFKIISKKRLDREMLLGYNLIGPQKDDYVFYLNEKNSKSYSSQGEKKSIIFSLKISEIDIIMNEKKDKPIFIIDDLSSYFDENRKNSILEYIKNRDIQCFITSTENLNIEGKKIIVDNGEIYG